MVDIGRAFGFVTEDEEWVTKVLIGGVLLLSNMIIPIVGTLALYGYMITMARNVAQGNPRPLPRWEDFGTLLMRGLYWFLIMLIYMIPVFVVYIGMILAVSVAGVALEGQGEDAVAMVIMGLLFCMLILILVCALFLSLMIYAATVRYIQTDELSAALKFGEVLALVRSSPRPWLMVLLISILAGLASSVGILACGIGVFFTSFYAYLVIGHALGQIAAQMGGIGSSYGTAPQGYGSDIPMV